MKRKPKNAGNKKNGLVVADHNWGATFRGTRKQLVGAGLVAPNMKMPGRGKEPTYWLPLNWKAGYDDYCYLGRLPAIPPRWDATLRPEEGIENDGTYRVSVAFSTDGDLAVRKRMQAALVELTGLYRAVTASYAAVERIAPAPLSEALPRTITESKNWGKSPAKEAA